MRGFLSQLTPMLLLILAGACSHHPVYGRPTPRTKEPATREPQTPLVDTTKSHPPTQDRRHPL